MEKACGLDVHKDSVFACILDENDKKNFEKRYGTLTPDLIELRDTLVEYGCGRVAAESTSIYWMPILNVLEADAADNIPQAAKISSPRDLRMVAAIPFWVK